MKNRNKYYGCIEKRISGNYKICVSIGFINKNGTKKRLRKYATSYNSYSGAEKDLLWLMIQCYYDYRNILPEKNLFWLNKSIEKLKNKIEKKENEND